MWIPFTSNKIRFGRLHKAREAFAPNVLVKSELKRYISSQVVSGACDVDVCDAKHRRGECGTHTHSNETYYLANLWRWRRRGNTCPQS